jgi:hypothetical protein
MTDVELLVSLQANRAIFVDYVIVQTLMAAVIVYVAYMFRSFSQLIRASAMIGAIISILSVTFFVTGVQMVFFSSASLMSEMAANGSDLANNFINTIGQTAGDPVSQPIWLTIFGVIQTLINLALTVYMYMFAKWDS